MILEEENSVYLREQASACLAKLVDKRVAVIQPQKKTHHKKLRTLSFNNNF